MKIKSVIKKIGVDTNGNDWTEEALKKFAKKENLEYCHKTQAVCKVDEVEKFIPDNSTNTIIEMEGTIKNGKLTEVSLTKDIDVKQLKR